MNRTIGLVAVCLLLTVPAFAQHADVVASVRAELVARGVAVVGPCGAGAILTRTAYRLRAEGAGLFEKLTGENCDGKAVDIIAYQDGRIYDVLVNAGTENLPAWNLVNALPENGLRWRPVLNDPDAGVGSAPPPSPPPPPSSPPPLPTVDLSGVLVRLAEIAAQNERIYADEVNRLTALSAQLTQHDEAPSYLEKIFGNRYVQLILAAVGTYVTTDQIKK